MLKHLREAKRGVSAACWQIVDDLLRTFLMVFILKPAAGILPRQRALAIARLCGLVMSYIPPSGRSAFATMRKAFGMEDAEARRSAREYLAQPFYSFVVFDGILHRREHPADWRVEERNNQEVVRLRESGRPFIVASGHFRRDSFGALYLPRFSPTRVATVFVPVAAPSLRPDKIRERVHYGQILKALAKSRPDNKFVYVGGAFRKLVKHLAEPGSQVVISADAFWKASGGSAYIRPFAGMRARTFSTGCALLSRTAQCPIAPLTSYLEKDGAVVLEWGPVIAPPRREDEAADIPITNALLDFLEDAIGRRPTQYVLYLGEERRWDRDLHVWKDLEERPG